MKWTGQSAKELGDGYKVFYSGSKDKKNGVGVVLDPEWKAAVVDVVSVRHNDRLMLVKVAQKEVINNHNLCMHMLHNPTAVRRRRIYLSKS